MALGQPDPVAGRHPEVGGVPGRVGAGVLQHHVGAVVDVPARVQGAPGEVGLLVGVEERAGERPDLVDHAHPDGMAAAQERGDRPGLHRVTGAEAGDVPALGEPGLVRDAEGHDPEPRVLLEGFPDQPEGVGAGQQAVIVQDDQHVRSPQLAQPLDAGVATPGDAEVLRQFHGVHPVRQFGQLHALSEHHGPHAAAAAVLGPHRVQQSRQLRRPVSHRQHHHAQRAAHRTRPHREDPFVISPTTQPGHTPLRVPAGTGHHPTPSAPAGTRTLLVRP